MPSDGLIHSHALCVGHGARALHGPLTLCVRAGEFWAIVGENGAGKTTLLRTLLGLHAPVSGEIERGARRDSGGRSRAVTIAYVPQRETVEHRVPMRVRAWIASGAERGLSVLSPRSLRRSREAVSRAAARAGCSELLDKPVHTLSKGQKQRALIARALVSEPDVLVLDEPTSAMDERAQGQTMGLISTLCSEGCAALVVSHHLSTLGAHASHGVVLSRQLAAPLAGTLDELADSPLIRAAFSAFFGAPEARFAGESARQAGSADGVSVPA